MVNQPERLLEQGRSFRINMVFSISLPPVKVWSKSTSAMDSQLLNH